jgi:hypothetical protein
VSIAGSTIVVVVVVVATNPELCTMTAGAELLDMCPVED